MMSRKRRFYILFFVLLTVIFYFVLTIVIPGYSRKKITPVSYVKPFSFTSQDGKPVTEKDVAGKVYVVEYFFTNCTGICPAMNNNMRVVYDEFKNEKDFLILSHTSDPERDSTAQMKYFADSMKVDTRRWLFLTGDKKSLYEAARFSYTIDDPANNLKDMDDQFIHSQYWALVDRNGDVMKIYDGLMQSEVNKLIKDARKLLKEE
jgi:protein SCO1/2